MELKSARMLGPSELYERRKQAIALHRKGMTRVEIAPLVGAHGNKVGQWPGEAVGHLVDKEFGISLPIRTVGWYLRRWGFTPQKPVRRAYKRSEPVVRKWLAETYPDIRRRDWLAK
jgi:transposase